MMEKQFGLLLILPVVLSSTYKEPFLMDEHAASSSSHFFLPENPEEPEFADWAETNVTAQMGGSVFLHCPVLNSGDRAVSYPSISWIRLRDWHILTTGVLTYTSDSRFQVLHKEGSYDWILQIKYVQERDAGAYDCQVSTSTGTISRKVHVNVVRPEAFILDREELHIDRGSQIKLICVIDKAPTPPQYVFWYHNDRMVNYDTERGISVFTSTGMLSEDGLSAEKTKSQFIIAEATPADSGNYTCKPSNAVPASIQVFVSNSRVDKTEALHKQSSLQISSISNTSSADKLTSHMLAAILMTSAAAAALCLH